MRDARGRFIRLRSYRLIYDGGHSEDVCAYTPSAAVAARAGGYGSLLPHTITDLTAIDAWLNGRGSRADAYRMPLLTRMYGDRT